MCPTRKTRTTERDSAEYQKRRMAYIVVNSLVPSQIEWDTVQLDNPSTWANWEKDLKDNGFSQMACNRVLALVLEANCLDEAKLQKAREVFLQGPPKGPASIIWPEYRTGELRHLEGVRPIRHPSARRQGVLGRLWRPGPGFDPGVPSDLRARRGRAGGQLAGARMPFG